MKVSREERQRRIDLIGEENRAIKKLNDLSEIKKRVEREKSLNDQAGIAEADESVPLKKIAAPDTNPNL